MNKGLILSKIIDFSLSIKGFTLIVVIVGIPFITIYFTIIVNTPSPFNKHIRSSTNKSTNIKPTQVDSATIFNNLNITLSTFKENNEIASLSSNLIFSTKSAALITDSDLTIQSSTIFMTSTYQDNSILLNSIKTLPFTISNSIQSTIINTQDSISTNIDLSTQTLYKTSFTTENNEIASLSDTSSTNHLSSNLIFSTKSAALITDSDLTLQSSTIFMTSTYQDKILFYSSTEGSISSFILFNSTITSHFYSNIKTNSFFTEENYITDQVLNKDLPSTLSGVVYCETTSTSQFYFNPLIQTTNKRELSTVVKNIITETDLTSSNKFQFDLGGTSIKYSSINNIETSSSTSNHLSTLFTLISNDSLSKTSPFIKPFNTDLSSIVFLNPTIPTSLEAFSSSTVKPLILTSINSQSFQSFYSTSEITNNNYFTSTQLTFIKQTTIPTCIDTSTFINQVKNTTCSSSSPSQPSFLTKETKFYFDYPIEQLITCNNGKVVLNCPPSLYLNIYSAYYGVQQKTSTYCSQPISDAKLTYPSVCFRSDTFDFIFTLCQNKSNCYLYADKSYFGDPCPDFELEQLFIQYQCVDSISLKEIMSCPKITKLDSICPPVTSSSIMQRTWCDFNRISISCTIGKYLNIICAVYGIDPNIRTCGFYYMGAPTSCNSYDTLLNLKIMCNYKNRCSFNYTSINNLCPQDYAPILIIQYECLTSIQMINAITTTTTLTSVNTYEQLSISNINQQNICYCSSNSIYTPKYLTISTYFSFGTRVFEQIGCYGTQINIVCEPNTLIHIFSAYFGIQYITNSDCLYKNGQTDIEIPNLCYTPLSYNQIVSKCEYKNSCLLSATFTDLNLNESCPDFRSKNQLYIQYQCIDSNMFNATTSKCILNKLIPSICSLPKKDGLSEGTWCDNGKGLGSIMNIQCLSNQKIEIKCAFYGKDTNISTCGQYSSICYFNSTLTLISNYCNGKNSCSLSNFKTTFSDACDGSLDQTLYVQWICI